MAKRYSGELVIRVTFHDYCNQYRCTVSLKGKRMGAIWVGLPGVLTQSVDCPAAYDDTARAVLAFIDDDTATAKRGAMIDSRGCGLASHAAFTDSGWHVGRSPRAAWPATGSAETR